MSDSEDNERVNEISRALQSMLSEPVKAPAKRASARGRKAAPKATSPTKAPTSKAKTKPKGNKLPSKTGVKSKTAKPAIKKPQPAQNSKTTSIEQSNTDKAVADGLRVIQNTDFALLAQRLRRALDDVKTGRVPTAFPPLQSLDAHAGENHQLISDIKSRLNILSDEIDIARADVAQKLLALDNLQRRLTLEVDDLLNQLGRRLDKNS